MKRPKRAVKQNGGRPARHRHLPRSPPRELIVVAFAHALGRLAHLARAVAHAARAFLEAVGGFDQLLVGDMWPRAASRAMTCSR